MELHLISSRVQKSVQSKRWKCNPFDVFGCACLLAAVLALANQRRRKRNAETI
jgi:hypothetical protein